MKHPIAYVCPGRLKTITRRVEGLFALADQIEARFQMARLQVDKLTPSLLARAFAGKLVPARPNRRTGGKTFGEN